MSDLEARRFRRNLTSVLTLVGLLTAGSVFLFGHLLFKTLSKDVVDEALLYSRQDAQRIARGLAERAAGDVYTLKVRQEDLDVFVGSALSDRRILSEVRVYDYVDGAVPVLARMAAKRLAGYRALGYSIELPETSRPGASGVLL